MTNDGSEPAMVKVECGFTDKAIPCACWDGRIIETDGWTFTGDTCDVCHGTGVVYEYV
jgi:hypothetical protein